MHYLDFPMSNITLLPPPGKEDEVVAIKAFRGGDFITIALEMTEEEAAALAERKVLWISFYDINPGGTPLFPPVRPDVMLPALVPFADLRCAGRAERCFLLQYLTLNLICLPVPENAHGFVFRSVVVTIDNADEPMYDLVYKTDQADLEPTSGEYFFAETLDVLGRFSDLPEFTWLQHIFPNCPHDVLVMRRKKAKPAASLIQMPGRK